jgi:hypothetical protein
VSVVILWAGLPGSGKTTYLCQMCRLGWLIFDDYKAGTPQDANLHFRKSPRFTPLIEALRNGLNCMVADIDFCRMEARDEARVELATEVPGTKMGWVYFENDTVACSANARNRNRDGLQTELENIEKYSVVYKIPQDAVVFPVFPRPAPSQVVLRTEDCS